MGEPVLRIEDRGRVRVITLDRPDARNAFNDELYDGVRQALADASADDDVSVCVITGAGPVFSAGQDLKALRTVRNREDVARYGFVPFVDELSAFNKPLLAAVQGAAVGIGITLLLHCDLVLASEAARFRTPFTSLGLVPEAASSLLLPARIGPQAAAHMLLASAWVDADQALASGLVWRVCPPEGLLDETLAVANEIAALPLNSLVATKQLLLDARADAVKAAHQREVGELGRIVKQRLEAKDMTEKQP
jgi:enoyl-CoA hydratase/carnithine racemase